MTDSDLVLKKLATIETYVAQLRTLSRPELLPGDLKEQRFIEHTLQIAIQAALDVASHIVSDERLGEPRSNRELFDLLAAGGWIGAEQATLLRRMVGFRNVLVHGYTTVNPSIVREVVDHRLDDLLQFVACVRERILHDSGTGQA